MESKKVMKQEILESNLKPNISTYGCEVHTFQWLYMVMTNEKIERSIDGLLTLKNMCTLHVKEDS